MIRGNEKRRSYWKIGIVAELISGRDGIVRAAKLRAGKSQLERAIQHLYPLEISCDNVGASPGTLTTINPNAEEFRPSRNSADRAKIRIRNMVANENEDSVID